MPEYYTYYLIFHGDYCEPYEPIIKLIPGEATRIKRHHAPAGSESDAHITCDCVCPTASKALVLDAVQSAGGYH